MGTEGSFGNQPRGKKPKMWLTRQLTKVFKETSMHGFHHVIEGKSPLERSVWVVVLVLSFVAFAFIATGSVREAGGHPVVTNAEFVDAEASP